MNPVFYEISAPLKQEFSGLKMTKRVEIQELIAGMYLIKNELFRAVIHNG